MPKRPLFIFDLDNTLYPPEVTLWRIVDARIEEYVRWKLGTDPKTAHRMRKAFLAEFGTTLRGLMHHHGVSPGDYSSSSTTCRFRRSSPRGRSCGRCSR